MESIQHSQIFSPSGGADMFGSLWTEKFVVMLIAVIVHVVDEERAVYVLFFNRRDIFVFPGLYVLDPFCFVIAIAIFIDILISLYDCFDCGIYIGMCREREAEVCKMHIQP